MDYFVNRTYDPAWGGFHQVDPLADDRDNVSWSPYVYVWNNPMRFIDPLGMKADTLAPGGFYTELVTMSQDNLKPEPIVDENLLENTEDEKEGIYLESPHKERGMADVEKGKPSNSVDPGGKTIGYYSAATILFGDGSLENAEGTFTPIGVEFNFTDGVNLGLQKHSQKGDSLTIIRNVDKEKDKRDTTIIVAKRKTGLLNKFSEPAKMYVKKK